MRFRFDQPKDQHWYHGERVRGAAWKDFVRDHPYTTFGIMLGTIGVVAAWGGKLLLGFL